MIEEVKRFVVDIQGREARECVFASDHDRIVAGLSEAGRKMQAERDQLVWQCKELEAALHSKEEFYQDALHSHVSLAKQRDRLAERCRELEVERDEADRRAGAAERKQAEEVDSRRRRDAWLHKAKEAAGYAQKESFDNVWAETLGKANERDTLRAEVERLRKDAERLTWLIDEEARIHGYLAQHGLRFGLVWPNGDQQADLFACPREAIDAALEASR